MEWIHKLGTSERELAKRLIVALERLRSPVVGLDQLADERVGRFLDGFDRAVDALEGPLVEPGFHKVRIVFLDTGITIEGKEISKMTIKDTQEFTREYGKPLDKRGATTSVEAGSEKWEASDDAVTVVQDTSNPLKAKITANHPSSLDAGGVPVPTVVTLTADADLGEGVKPVSVSDAIIVTTGDAVGFGAPTDSEVTEQP